MQARSRWNTWLSASGTELRARRSLLCHGTDAGRIARAAFMLTGMRHSLALAAAVILSACAPSITGNELGGIISHEANEQDEAFAQADRYCQRYNKRARIQQIVVDRNQIAFDCVTP